MPLVWIHRGPMAGSFREMSAEDAAAAEREGWGQITNGRDGKHMNRAERGPHPAAEAYATRTLTRSTKNEPPPAAAPAGEAAPTAEPAGDQSYATREMRADQPAKKRGRPPKPKG